MPHQLREDDEEEEELCDVGEEADEGADVVKDGLEALHARLEGREEGVVHHGGGVPEKEGLDDVPQSDGEDQREDGPLGDGDEPVDADLDEEVVVPYVEDPHPRDDEAPQGAVADGEHAGGLHGQPEHLDARLYGGGGTFQIPCKFQL